MPYQILRNEGVHILPVKLSSGPHQYLCSPQDLSPVKIKHASIARRPRFAARLAQLSLILVLAFSALGALAQSSDTIDQIRVIGNRRIPKETILARLFTHPGDTYDPVSIERDFNSLWNTGYFEDLRIEREDTDKGIILNVVRPRAAHHPRDQLQGHQLGQHLRHPGSLQERESRPLR